MIEPVDQTSPIEGAPPVVLDAAARRARAETIVKDHVLLGGASGLVPVPLFDLAAAIAVQITLIGRLAKLYEVSYSRSAARAIVVGLLGGIGAVGLAGGVFFSLAKLIPGMGTVIGYLAMPAGMAAVTWAIGKLFIGHFESGGTLLDLNVEANRRYFAELLRRGRKATADWVAPKPSAADPH